MKFCTQCGGKLRAVSSTHFVCSDCSRDLFSNPKGAVAILLISPHGELILARRARDPEKGKLDPIGGFLDVGECFEEALYRELEEESGLGMDDIEAVRYLGSAHDYYHWQGVDEPVISAYFTAVLKPGRELKAADDVASYEFLQVGSIDQDQLAWPGLQKMLAKFTSDDQ
ncbi:NUDIX hydrolase [Spirochaeta dissipatitropha]